MIYDIINPSDSYTIEAHDLKVAAVACVLLGNGQYGFEPIDGEGESIPLMLFGGADKWFKKQFGANLEATLGEVMQQRPTELADCLDTCVIGTLADRMDFDAAVAAMEPGARIKFRAERHDRRRSSMNDIGARAYKMAQKLRERAANPVEPAPKQVLVGPHVFID